MKHQTAIKNPRCQGIRLALREHVEEIGGVGQIIPGLNRVLAFADQLKCSHHRGDLGDQPNHRVVDVLRVVDRPTRIEQPQRRRTGLQRVHRVTAGREALHHVPHPEADPPVHLHSVFELSQLVAAGQLPPDQQVGRFQEAAVRRQILHRVAAIGKQPLLSIDIANRRLGCRHAIQAWTQFDPGPRMAQVTCLLLSQGPVASLSNLSR